MFGSLLNLVTTICGLASRTHAGRHVATHSAVHLLKSLFRR